MRGSPTRLIAACSHALENQASVVWCVINEFQRCLTRKDTGAKAIVFCANQLGITVSSDHISRSHRTGKRGRTPRPIIVRLVHYNMKVQLLRKRRELKARETNFDIQEDLTQCRRDILHYLHNDITECIIEKVWTIDGIIFMRPTSRSSVIEKCSILSKCREIVNK